MRALIVGVADLWTAQLRRQLSVAGIDCDPLENISVDSLSEHVAQSDAEPDVIFFKYSATTLQDDSVAQIKRYTTANVVVFGNTTNSRQVMQLIRQGASDYIHESDHFEEELNEILERMESQHHADAKLATTISVMSVGGGCGASFVAANLAAVLAQQNLAPYLLDLNLRGGDLAAMLNLTPQHTLQDLCRLEDVLDSQQIEKSLLEHPCGLKLLASSSLMDTDEPLSGEKINQVYGQLRRLCKYLIVDLEDAIHREQLGAIQISQTLLLVLRLEFPCLIRAARILQHLENNKIPLDRVQLVANRFGHKSELPQRQIVKALGRPLTCTIPCDYAVAASAINVGNPAVLEFPRSKLAAAFQELGDTVLQTAQQPTSLSLSNN